ncbi:MAG: fimbrillin family protein [Bacteroides sp.]|nr:fimbrillin family protein [Bacteroides sp.]
MANRVLQGAKGVSLYLALVAGALGTTSCQDELNNGQPIRTGHQITFCTQNDTVWDTRSLSDNRPETRPSGSAHFLGMVEGDSLFISVVEEENDAPLFPTAGTQSHTKGVYASGEFSSFFLTAYLENGSLYVDNQKLEKKDENWNYSPTLYWPKDYSLHFFAYAWNIGNKPITPQFSMANNTYGGSFSYALPTPSAEEVKNDAEAQPDLIFAITPEQTRNSNPVSLTFYHALSAIAFRLGEMPAGATVSGATISLANVYAAGTCTMSYPLTGGEGFSWSYPGTPTLQSYTENFSGVESGQMLSTDAETFLMIPQPLKEKEALLQVSFRIGAKDYNFEKKLGELTEQWAPHKRYTYVLSRSGYVEVSVDDRCTTDVKSDVKIQNTGLTTAYIRATIVGYWESPNGDIVSAWDINDTDAGTLQKAANWETYWKQGDDGFYYHTAPVAAGNFTQVPLFERYELKSRGPVQGSKLIISIVSQAIATDLLNTAWPDSPLATNSNNDEKN